MAQLCEIICSIDISELLWPEHPHQYMAIPHAKVMWHGLRMRYLVFVLGLRLSNVIIVHLCFFFILA